MGAWGTGVFENDTASDALIEMASLIRNYFKGLIDSDDEHNIMFAGFLYLLTESKDNENIKENLILDLSRGDADPEMREDIDIILNGLSFEDVKPYKYTLIGKLYKCLDDATSWEPASVYTERKAIVQQMIDYIAKER